jgi:gliding motility-associated-like protein
MAAASAAYSGSASEYDPGGLHSRMSRTSHAAPSVTGVVALYLQQNPTATAIQVRDAVINYAFNDNFTGSTPNDDWGYGKIDAYAMLTNTVTLITSPISYTICSNGNAPFTANHNNPAVTYQWQEDTGSGFVNLVNGGIYSGVTTKTLTLSVIPAIADANKYRCFLDNPMGCGKYTDAATLSVTGGPEVTFASTIDSTCYNAGVQTADLAYTSPVFSPNLYSITWGATAIAEGFVNLTDAALPASPIVINVPAAVLATTYTASITLKNAVACVSPTYTTSITIDTVIFVNGGGGGQAVCEVVAATVSGISAGNGTLLWAHNGAGSLANATTYTPTYTPVISDTNSIVTLTMTMSATNACGAYAPTATYTVSVEGMPDATAGGNATICVTNPGIVSGATKKSGAILWTHDGLGTIFSGATTLSPIYVPVLLDAGNAVVLTMTVSANTPACGANSATATFTLNIDGAPTASAGGNDNICEDATAIVSGATGNFGAISWSENGAGSLTNALTYTPTYTPHSIDKGTAVKLTMTVSSTNTCIGNATALYTVNVDGLPTASAGGSETICENGTVIVSGASVTNGSIVWTHNGSGPPIVGPNILTPTYTAVPTDTNSVVTLTMTVTSTNTCGGTAIATYSVTVDGLPTVTTPTSFTICENAPRPITGANSTNGSVLWTHNGSGAITNSNSLTPTYTANAGDANNTVKLYLNVNGSNAGCGVNSVIDSCTIVIAGLPVATTGNTVDSICVTAIATVAGAIAKYGTVNWSTNGTGTLANDTTLSPTYTPLANEAGEMVTLTMTVTSTTSCAPQTDSAKYYIKIDPLPTATLDSNLNIACVLNPLEIKNSTVTNGTVIWSEDGAGSFTSDSTAVEVVYLPVLADVDSVITLVKTVTSNNACAPQSLNDSISFTVNASPEGVILSGLQPSNCYNAAVTTLKGLPTGGYFIGEGIIDTVLGTFNPLKAGEGVHTISYVYNDSIGCSTTSTLITVVLPEALGIDSCTTFSLRSNVFTPNGDGINDQFTISFTVPKGLYTGDAYESFTISIYSKWGVEVFTSHSPLVSWDGYNPSGVKVTAGTYYYVVDMFGEKHKGFITLMR